MSDFLRSFGSAFDGVVTERPWPTNALTQDLTPEIREKT